jgi:hypothetical protein
MFSALGVLRSVLRNMPQALSRAAAPWSLIAALMIAGCGEGLIRPVPEGDSAPAGAVEPAPSGSEDPPVDPVGIDPEPVEFGPGDAGPFDAGTGDAGVDAGSDEAAPPSTGIDGGVPDQLLATFNAMPLSAFGGVTGDALATEFARAPDWLNRIDELSVIAETQGRSLRQRYTPTSEGSPVVMFPMPIAGGMEVWLSYRMLFETGWEWVKGGKLPGLGGGTYPTGGQRDDNGFSARFMWRTNGELSVYAYHHDRPTVYGEDFYLVQTDGTRWRAPINQWFTIRQRIKMNASGSTYDGEVEAWIDGERKLLKTGLRWRKNTTYTCDAFLYSTFYGGADPSWAPSRITYARFDDFKVASTAAGVE